MYLGQVCIDVATLQWGKFVYLGRVCKCGESSVIHAPHLDDIWYVGRAKAEGAYGDLHGSQRSSEVKWGKLCAMATVFGQKKP